MTVGDKLHKTLASLRGCKADMESFTMETNDKNAKQLYADSAEQLEQIISSISGRVNYVEDEEPAFNMNPNKKQ